MEAMTTHRRETASNRALATAAAMIFIRLCGILFIYAGLRKATDASELSRVFEFYRFPRTAIEMSVWAVTLGEVALGTLLLLKPLSKPLLYTLTGILIIYSVNLGILLSSEQAPSCGCLMQEYEQGRHGKIVGLVRNCVLVTGIAGAIFLTRARRSSLGSAEDADLAS
jgi:uncharacterized membrane protein YphA (DoxX/SURF4 family)